MSYSLLCNFCSPGMREQDCVTWRWSGVSGDARYLDAFEKGKLLRCIDLANLVPASLYLAPANRSFS